MDIVLNSLASRTRRKSISHRQILDEIVRVELQKLVLRTRLRGGNWSDVRARLLIGDCPDGLASAIRQRASGMLPHS